MLNKLANVSINYSSDEDSDNSCVPNSLEYCHQMDNTRIRKKQKTQHKSTEIIGATMDRHNELVPIRILLRLWY